MNAATTSPRCGRRSRASDVGPATRGRGSAWLARLGGGAIATMVAAGCGHIDAHTVLLRQAGPPSSSQVGVYFARAGGENGGEVPPHPYYAVALLQVVGHGTDANLEDMVEAIAARARALGCDAIVDLRHSEGVTLSHAYGVCVRWLRAVEPPGSAPPRVDAPPAERSPTDSEAPRSDQPSSF